MRSVGYHSKINPKFFFSSKNLSVLKVKKMKSLTLTPSKSTFLRLSSSDFVAFYDAYRNRLKDSP